MEKIKPAVDAAAVTARMLKDEKGSLVRLGIARQLFLWTGLAYFLLVLATVGGLAAGDDLAARAVAQAAFVVYPAFLLSLATLAHAAWSHAAYVRTGRRRVPVFTAILAIGFAVLVLPHFGLDARFVKNVTGFELSDGALRGALESVKQYLP